MMIVDHDSGDCFQLINSFNWGTTSQPHNFPQIDERQFREQSRSHIDGLCTSLAGPWSINFYHWCEELGKVIQIERDGIRPTYLVPNNASMYKDSLLYFGVDEARIVEVGPSPISCSQYLVPPVVRFTRGQDKVIIDDLRKAVFARTQDDRTVNPICFVMRDSQHLVFSSRSILNREEVIGFCEHHGIDLVDPSRMQFSEQLQAFRSRSIISGVHGAGLSHQLWMREGSCVIDAMSPKYVNPSFGVLANILNFSYFLLTQTYMESHGMTCDIAQVQVPIDQLEWAMKSSRRLIGGSERGGIRPL